MHFRSSQFVFFSLCPGLMVYDSLYVHFYVLFPFFLLRTKQRTITHFFCFYFILFHPWLALILVIFKMSSSSSSGFYDFDVCTKPLLLSLGETVAAPIAAQVQPLPISSATPLFSHCWILQTVLVLLHQSTLKKRSQFFLPSCFAGWLFIGLSSLPASYFVHLWVCECVSAALSWATILKLK